MFLQAAVLALGGDAKMTKRATNMGSFVRHDCNKAEIRVRLSNVGDDHAFRPEVYGSAIIMERTIYISPGGQVQSRHAVRNAGGKIVYETSELRCNQINIGLNFDQCVSSVITHIWDPLELKVDSFD